jgi:hypothetical protein
MRCTAPHAHPPWPWRSGSAGQPPLAGLGRRGPRAPKHRVRPRGHGLYRQPAAATPPRPPPFVGVQGALPRGADVLSGLTPQYTGRGPWTARALVQHTPPRRPILQPALAPRVRPPRFPRRGPTRRLPGARRGGPAEVAHRTRRRSWLGTRVCGGQGRGRGVTTRLTHAPCDGAPSPHVAAPLALGAPVHGAPRLRQHARHGRAPLRTRGPASGARASMGAAHQPRFRVRARTPDRVSWPVSGGQPSRGSPSDARARSASASRAGAGCRAARLVGYRPRDVSIASSATRRRCVSCHATRRGGPDPWRAQRRWPSQHNPAQPRHPRGRLRDHAAAGLHGRPRRSPEGPGQRPRRLSTAVAPCKVPRG